MTLEEMDHQEELLFKWCLDGLQGPQVPLHKETELESWLEILNSQFLPARAKSATAEATTVQAVVRQIKDAQLHREAEWFVTYRGATLEVLLGFLNLVVSTNKAAKEFDLI